METFACTCTSMSVVPSMTSNISCSDDQEKPQHKTMINCVKCFGVLNTASRAKKQLNGLSYAKNKRNVHTFNEDSQCLFNIMTCQCSYDRIQLAQICCIPPHLSIWPLRAIQTNAQHNFYPVFSAHDSYVAQECSTPVLDRCLTLVVSENRLFRAFSLDSVVCLLQLMDGGSNQYHRVVLSKAHQSFVRSYFKSNRDKRFEGIWPKSFVGYRLCV